MRMLPLAAPLYIIGIGRRRASLHATRIGSVLGVDLDHIPLVDEERHAYKGKGRVLVGDDP